MNIFGNTMCTGNHHQVEVINYGYKRQLATFYENSAFTKPCNKTPKQNMLFSFTNNSR